jgi:hypothetical protein
VHLVQQSVALFEGSFWFGVDVAGGILRFFLALEIPLIKHNLIWRKPAWIALFRVKK